MSALGLRPGVPTVEPLYRAARSRLLQGLATNRWPPGAALPPEKDLAADFGISIGTLRKAVDELVAEGMLIRQQGRGTFVASHDRDRLLYYFFHIVAFDAGKDQYPHVELLGFARDQADGEAAAKLGIAPQAPVWRLRNRLSLGDRPVMVDDIVLDAARFPRLSEARLRNRPSTLYALYQQDFGQTVVQTAERLRAVTVPDDVAPLLGLPRRAPALMIRRVALGYRREPIEWRLSHVDTRAHEYFSELGP